MSKLIRSGALGPAVPVGEKHLDVEHQAQAEQTLRHCFPAVNLINGPDGARLIPVIESQKIVAEHESRLRQEKEQAYREGYQAGVEQARTEARAEMRGVLQRFDEAIRDAVEQRERILLEAKQKILELVILISRKVTFDAANTDPEITLSIISGVIDTLVDRSRLRIKVRPDHYPYIKENVERFATDSALIKSLTVEPDPRVKCGGCLIETPGDDIDARLESQFEVIRETILSGEERP